MDTTAEGTTQEIRHASDPPMRAILEALLYASPDPVEAETIKEAFGAERAAEVDSALAALIDEYSAAGRGLMVERVAGGYRIVTRPEMAGILREFVKVRNRMRLSKAALETLSVVAYRQPVTGPEIEAIRGVNPSAILRSLLDRRMVKIVGRKKVVGKPFLYGTTPEFLLQFGLNSLDDLPSMEEFAGLLDSMQPLDAEPEIQDHRPDPRPVSSGPGDEEGSVSRGPRPPRSPGGGEEE
jgi:segregation and condensation protein B